MRKSLAHGVCAHEQTSPFIFDAQKNSPAFLLQLHSASEKLNLFSSFHFIWLQVATQLAGLARAGHSAMPADRHIHICPRKARSLQKTVLHETFTENYLWLFYWVCITFFQFPELECRDQARDFHLLGRTKVAGSQGSRPKAGPRDFGFKLLALLTLLDQRIMMHIAYKICKTLSKYDIQISTNYQQTVALRMFFRKHALNHEFVNWT